MTQLIPKVREKITLAQFVITAAILLILPMLLYIAVLVKSNKQETTVVQLVDGRSIVGENKPASYRTPEQVEEFTKEWASWTFSADGKIPGTDEVDPGRETNTGEQVTSNAWVGSFMLDTDFRQEFLDVLAEIMPTEDLISGRLTSSLIPDFIESQQVSETTWEVTLISSILLIDKATGVQEERIPFNKAVTIEVTTVPSSPLGEDANTLEKVAYKMRARGLKITELLDYQE